MTGVLVIPCSKCGRPLNIPVKNYADAKKIGSRMCKQCNNKGREKVCFT